MKIALVMPPQRTASNLFTVIHELSQMEPHLLPIFDFFRSKMIDFRNYPYALLLLATIIDKKHEVKIFNFLDRETKIKDIIKFQPDIIGFYTCASDILIWVHEVARSLKRKLGATIIFGGPFVSMTPEQTLLTTVCDYVVIGEAELVINDLINFIDGKSNKLPQSGVAYKRNGKIVIKKAIAVCPKKIPIVDHSFLDLDKYKSIHIEISRGCPWSCPFCFINAFKNEWKDYNYRVRNEDDVIKELKQISNLTDIEKKKIYIVDSNFKAGEEKIKNILLKIKKLEIKTSFWAATDSLISYEILKLMKDVGFSYIHIGIETASEGFLGELPKIPNLNHILNFYKKLKKLRIVGGAEFVLMYPQQTKEDLKRLKCFAFQLQKEYGPIVFQPHLFRPYPKTLKTFELIDKNWNSPQSFLEWGYLYRKISLGKFDDETNFTKDITSNNLQSTLKDFLVINLMGMEKESRLIRGFYSEKRWPSCNN